MRKVLSFILGFIFIVFKLTFIIDIIITTLKLVIGIILHRRLSDAGIKPRYNNCLNQCLSFRGYWKYWQIDYFKEKGTLKREIKNDFENDFKKLSQISKGGIIKIGTNQWVYNNVIKELGSGYEVLIDDKSKKSKIQFLEKLDVMSSITVWKNIFTSKFWQTVFRDEVIHTYYVKV
ncbi:MAG: hypothetical protein RR851_14345 [Clostridium sp.]